MIVRGFNKVKLLFLESIIEPSITVKDQYLRPYVYVAQLSTIGDLRPSSQIGRKSDDYVIGKIKPP